MARDKVPGVGRRAVRYFLLALGVVQLALTAALLVQWQPLIDLWPFANTTPLTFIFVASIVVAAAASTLWAAATENYGALAGIGLDYLTIFSALTVIMASLASIDDVRRITGWLCIRVTWADLHDPERLARRIRQAFADQA